MVVVYWFQSRLIRIGLELGVILKTKTRFLFEEPKHKPRFPIDFHPVFILKVFIPWPSRENHDFCYHPTLHFHVWNKPMTILNSRITHVPTLSKLKVLAYSNFQQGGVSIPWLPQVSKMRPYDTLGIFEDSYSLRIGSSGAFHHHLGYQRCEHMIPWAIFKKLILT